MEIINNYNMHTVIFVLALLISILNSSIISKISDFAICDKSRCIYGTCTNKTLFIHNKNIAHIKSTCICKQGWTGENCDTCNGRST